MTVSDPATARGTRIGVPSSRMTTRRSPTVPSTVPRVICDVGGTDVKIMILRQGTVADFRLNSQCSSGNGAFLQGVAERYSIPLEA